MAAARRRGSRRLWIRRAALPALALVAVAGALTVPRGLVSHHPERPVATPQPPAISLVVNSPWLFNPLVPYASFGRRAGAGHLHRRQLHHDWRGPCRRRAAGVARLGLRWLYRKIDLPGYAWQQLCATSPVGGLTGVNLAMNMSDPASGKPLGGATQLGVLARLRFLGPDPAAWTGNPVN